MDIKDYIHLYLGCKVTRIDVPDEIRKLVGISMSEVEPEKTVAIIGGPVFQEWYIEDTKLILRELSDMKADEWKDMFDMPGMSMGGSSMDLWLETFEQFELRPKFGYGKKWQLANPTKDVPTKKIKVADGLKWEFYTYSPSALLFLLSKGFDLFGLIDAGLAINSTTLNNGKE